MKRKLGKKIFETFNVAVAMLFFIAASGVDCGSWYPTIICALCLAYGGCAVLISRCRA